MKNSHLAYLGIALVFGLLLCLSQCTDTREQPDSRGSVFAPAGTCRQCHQAIVDSAQLSAHAFASFAMEGRELPGNFVADRNAFVYGNGSAIKIEKRNDGYYQVLYANKQQMEDHRFDLGFGGRHAFTWIYWQDDRAYELPVSWYKAVNNWGTSPGFSATQPNFTRLVGTDCFECHSSYIAHKKNTADAGDYFSSPGESEILEKGSMIYGLDCQRCHGPAAEHVAFQQQHPGDTMARQLVNIHKLGRQQQLDACAVCHSGNDKQKLRSRFGFGPGDLLGDYFLSVSSSGNKKPDVHGNQLGLLQQSKCFQGVSTITCGTCHDPHKQVSRNLAIYSQKCMGCHNEAANNFCTVATPSHELLKQNCIDCHMPVQASGAINYQITGSKEPLAYRLRTHKIAVYKDD